MTEPLSKKDVLVLPKGMDGNELIDFVKVVEVGRVKEVIQALKQLICNSSKDGHKICKTVDEWFGGLK